jgi:hypothetical protein
LFACAKLIGHGSDWYCLTGVADSFVYFPLGVDHTDDLVESNPFVLSSASSAGD